MKICIIGSGASGLAALRVLSEKINSYPTTWELFSFERTDSIGGVWKYDRDIYKPYVSPMYQDLKTNLPKEIMAYPDCPYPKDIQCSFVHHTDVLRYISQYSAKHNLEKYIQFNSNITNVEPLICDSETQWKVCITNTVSLLKEERIFDVVIVANGHFEHPFTPEIEGIEYFKGEMLHSKMYRIAEAYTNKIVFILGARNSGTDIATQLSKTAKKVYLSHNKDRLKCERFHGLITETYGICKVDSEGFIWTLDGNKYEADVIIFCTGYSISLDFLSKSCQVQYDNAYIRPLYKHLISPYYPKSLFFIGMGYEITAFTFFYLQSKVIRAILQNCFKGVLLSTEVLLQSIDEDNKKQDEDLTPKRYMHYFNLKQWPYFKWCEDVSREVMTAKIPTYLEYMFNIVKKWRFENMNNYREIQLELSDENALGFIVKTGPDNDYYTEDFNNYLANILH